MVVRSHLRTTKHPKVMINNKQKHLEFIQGVISRMGNNSFLIRGWSMTLIAGILALGISQNIKGLWPISIFSIIVFWFLDSYFLSQEKLYRKLYDFVRQQPENKIDFSMDISNVESDGCSLLDCAFSVTIGVFYIGALIITYIIFNSLS
jgi:hypothetical protein